MSRYNNQGSGKAVFRGTEERDTVNVDNNAPMKYAKCLMNPFSTNQDARIPDGEVGIPTATFDFVQEDSITISGTTGLLVYSLGAKPRRWQGTLSGPAGTFAFTPNSGGWNAQLTAGTTLDNTYTSIGPVVDTGVLPSVDAWDGWDAEYRGFRLVAAGLKVEFAGNDTQNSGIITGHVLGGGYEVISTFKKPRVQTRVVASTLANQNGKTDDFRSEWFSDWEGANVVLNAAEFANFSSAAPNSYISVVNTRTAAQSQVMFSSFPLIRNYDTLRELNNAPGNYIGPAKDGCVLRYFPSSPSDLKFRRPPSNNADREQEVPFMVINTMSTTANPSYNSATNVAFSAAGGLMTGITSQPANFKENLDGGIQYHLGDGDVQNGCFIVAFNGCATGAIYRVKVVYHYEAIPTYNENSVDQTAVAGVSTAAMDAVQNMIAKTSKAGKK